MNMDFWKLARPFALTTFCKGCGMAHIAGGVAAVYAAMAYYYEYQAEIDCSITADREFAEAFRNNNPSPLRSKLQALKHD
jgi:hypothetical protein